jgi:hypothetical protein
MTTSETDSRSDTRRSTAGTIVYLLAGPIVWAAHLTILYFVQSMLCAHGLAGRSVAGVGLVPVVIVSATAVGLAILLAAILAPAAASRLAHASGWSMPDRVFHRRVMVALAVLSALGIAWAGFTAFVVPACPQLR